MPPLKDANHALTSAEMRSPAPGTVEKMQCPTCGDEMDVTRNVMGPTGFAEAVGRGGHLHDRFVCSHAGEVWHTQVIKLKELVRNTPSAIVAQLIGDEVVGILKTRKPTKTEFER